MAANSGIDEDQIFGKLAMEMEPKEELFKRLAMACYEKCINKRFSEPELTKGETVCLDRCISKYFEVNNMAGQMLSASQRPK